MPTSSKTQRQDPTSSIINLLNLGSLSYPIEHYSQDVSKSHHCKCRWFCSCDVVGILLRDAQEEESSSSTAKPPDYWKFASSAVRLSMAQVAGMEQAVWANIQFTVWSEYCDYARNLWSRTRPPRQASNIYNSRPRVVMGGECVSKVYKTLLVHYGQRWCNHQRLQASYLNIRISRAPASSRISKANNSSMKCSILMRISQTDIIATHRAWSSP